MSQKPRYSFVLLAAGRSERMQTDKALLDFQGRPWIQRQIEQIRKSDFIDQIYIVANPNNISMIRSAVSTQAEILENNQENADTFSSVLIGLNSCLLSDGVFISPIDVPLNSEIIDQLAGAKKENKIKVISPEQAGKKGHPVLLLQSSVKELLQEKARSQRLDFYLRSLDQKEWLSVAVNDPQIHLNLNTPKAWSDFLENA